MLSYKYSTQTLNELRIPNYAGPGSEETFQGFRPSASQARQRSKDGAPPIIESGRNQVYSADPVFVPLNGRSVSAVALGMLSSSLVRAWHHPRRSPRTIIRNPRRRLMLVPLNNPHFSVVQKSRSRILCHSLYPGVEDRSLARRSNLSSHAA